jgi:hypothetical protein
MAMSVAERKSVAQAGGQAAALGSDDPGLSEYALDAGLHEMPYARGVFGDIDLGPSLGRGVRAALVAIEIAHDNFAGLVGSAVEDAVGLYLQSGVQGILRLQTLAVAHDVDLLDMDRRCSVTLISGVTGRRRLSGHSLDGLGSIRASGKGVRGA